jgi:PAS domain S-box-containing protein
MTSQSKVRGKSFNSEFWASIFELSNECIKILDLDGNLMYMNSHGLQVMEIDDFSLCQNKQWTDFWNEKGQAAARNAIIAAKNGQSSTFKEFCLTAKGVPKWWEVTVKPIRDFNGDIVNFLAVSRDITKEKNQEADLERASRIADSRAKRQIQQLDKAIAEQRSLLDHIQALLEVILNNIDDLIIVFDPDLNYTLINNSTYRRMGINKKNIIGKNILDIYPGIQSSVHYKSLVRASHGEIIHLEKITGVINSWDLFNVDYIPIIKNGRCSGTLVLAKQMD